MSTTTDPPSAERKSAEFWRRARGICRRLVNRRTLLSAFRFLALVVRIIEMVKRLHGDF